MDENANSESIRIEGRTAILSINAKVYPLEAIYSASYVFLDKAYIILDGNPEDKIIVKITSKKTDDPSIMGLEFYNELINYADYGLRAKNTKDIRQAILRRVLQTNTNSKKEDLMEEDDNKT